MTRAEPHDLDFMARALRLAADAPVPSPNPRVGAVLVRDGRVIGEGAHAGPGTDHAEAIAIRAAGNADGATLYVNLEPCVHTGRTGPCAPAVVEAGAKRVVVAMEDPDARVSGAGIEVLCKHGILVDVGTLEEEARRLNAPYVVHRAQGRSFIHLKLALSIDGRLAAADGSSRWITGEGARERVHLRRASSDAILIGVGSVLADDPQLTVRGVDSRRRPMKVIVDSTGRTFPDARLFEEGEVVIATTQSCSFERQTAYKEAGAEVVILDGTPEGTDLHGLTTWLAGRDVLEVLCEGGAALATSLLRAGLVDRLEIHTGPILLGSGPTIEDLGIVGMDGSLRFRLISSEVVGDDIVALYERASS